MSQSENGIEELESIAIDLPQELEQDTSADPTVKWFWWFSISHVVAWVVTCVLTQPNMPLDMVEMLFWGQQWQLGYHKHPPLPAWIAAGTWWLSGGQAWLMYVVSQLTILVTFWAVWQLAREGLSPKAAFCSVVVLEGCYYCAYMINDINNTIITRPFWALAILFLYRAISRTSKTQSNLNWCLAGVAIGLGMFSKYYIGVLVLAMLAVPVLIPQTRTRLKTVGPYLLAIVACLVFLPHLLWMIDNDFVTIRYVFQRSDEKAVDVSAMRHLLAPIKFVASQIGAFLPMLVLAWPMLSERKIRSRESDSDGQLFYRYVSIVTLGPILIYVLLSAVSGASIRSMWGGPLFSFLGVWLFATFQLPADNRKVRKIIRDSIIVGVCMLLALVARNLSGPLLRDKLSRIHFPGAELAEALNGIWDSSNGGEGSELKVVGGHMFIAASASVYSQQHIDVYAGLSEEASPWINDEKFQSRGGMIVWEILDDNSRAPDSRWLERFPGGKLLEPIRLNSRAIGGPHTVEVGVILVPAQKPRQ